MNARPPSPSSADPVRHLQSGWLVALAALAASLPALAQAPQFYRLESALTMKSAAPNWDYVTFDPARSYLYIARREDGVTVYDAATKKVLGSIENSAQANAITLVQEFDRGYTTNEDGSTTVFEISSLKTLSRLKLADSADSAVYEPIAKQLIFTIGDNKQVLFLNPRTNSIVGKLELQSAKLEHPTADGQGNVFVAQRDKDVVVRIDVKLRKAIAEWKTEGRNPVLAVMDSESGKVITTSEIGRGNDGVVYDAETHKIFTSNGIDGNLVVIDQIDANTYKLAEATTTRPYARTMALDPKTKKVFLVTAEGTVDPAKKVNRGVAPFYPNKYFSDTFTLLTLSRQ